MGIKFFILAAVYVVLCGCANQQASNVYKTAESSAPIVDEKYRLTADREKLEELRKEIPPDKKTENDELAFVLQMTAEKKYPPNELRQRFDSALRKKRDLFNRDLQKERESFSRKEKIEREQFLKDMSSARSDFLKSKRSKSVRDHFFNEQDERRKTFFANQKERRNDFESNVQQKRKDFEDYIRQKTSEFDFELKSYKQRYSEK